MADTQRTSLEPPDENLSAEDEAFYGYMEVLRHELEKNWNGGYAQMPNEIRADHTLSHKAKEVYEQLLSFMWFKSDRCWPSQKTIAEATGYSRRSVIRALNELYERGYIEKWRRGLGQTNFYFINPLSFARSFRPLPGPRTGKSLPHNNILSVDASELRLDLSRATPRPVEPIYPEVPNSHNESAKDAHQEVPNSHTNHIQANPNAVEPQSDSTRSGKAAKLGVKGGVAPTAIRNAQTKGTNEDQQQRNQSKSNKTVAFQETDGAAHAEEVKEVKRSRRKKHAKGEVPPPLPTYLETNILAPISVNFSDQARASSRTSFAWIYAEVSKRGQDEYSEAFDKLVNGARDETIFRASKGLVTGRNRDGTVAMMPYFLSILESDVDAWCEVFDKAVAEQAKPSEQNDDANGKPLVDEGEDRTENEPLPTASPVEVDRQHNDATSPASIEPPVADQQEQAAPKRCIATNDPNHGWSEQNAAHFAQRLRDVLGGSSYWQYSVVPTLASGYFGFVLKEVRSGKEWEYTRAEYDEAMRANKRVR